MASSKEQPIQVRVAMEFGYDLSLIQAARQQQTFESAADLMEYIDYHPDLQPHSPSSNATVSSARTAVVNLSLSPPNTTPSTNLSLSVQSSNSLLRETQLLYASLHCYLCGIRRREILLLPCSELLLCQRCVHTCTECPRCHSPIQTLIHARWA